MPIVEEGSNFPGVLGRKNVLSTKSWDVGRMIGDLPSVRGIGRSPGMLPQVLRQALPPRGTGLRTGRAGARRYGFPRTDEERRARHYDGDISLAGEREVEVHNLMTKQQTQGMGLGIRERLQYRFGKLKGRFPMFSQRWGPERPIADLPKPMSILSGPEHGQYPQRIAIEW